MPLLIRIAALLAVPACSGQWSAPAQGKATIRRGQNKVVKQVTAPPRS